MFYLFAQYFWKFAFRAVMLRIRVKKNGMQKWRLLF